ncbi:MAG: ABC transporter ATP-binding protein [Anaerolineaceae bacterium]|jgi:ABC-2 type transport system ATP-binding protein
MEQETIISATNIWKAFGRRVILDDLNFIVPRGVIYAICGKNGIGKSVFLRTLSGFIIPDRGTVTIHGQEIGKEIEFPRSTGILIDRPGFMPEKNGYGNLSLLGQISGHANKGQIRSAMESVGLEPDDGRPVRTYSIGMLQRLGLAQAIMEDPDLLLLDEPTSGLDYETQEAMYGLLRSLRERGKTIVFTSHSPYEVKKLSEKTYWLIDGKLQTLDPGH